MNGITGRISGDVSAVLVYYRNITGLSMSDHFSQCYAELNSFSDELLAKPQLLES